MYAYFIRMSLVCTHMSSVCRPYVLVCHSRVTRMYQHMYSYVNRTSFVCTHISPVCHSYVHVCHPYLIRMYSYVTCMSLVCTRMSFVCQSSVVLPSYSRFSFAWESSSRQCTTFEKAGDYLIEILREKSILPLLLIVCLRRCKTSVAMNPLGSLWIDLNGARQSKRESASAIYYTSLSSLF